MECDLQRRWVCGGGWSACVQDMTAIWTMEDLQRPVGLDLQTREGLQVGVYVLCKVHHAGVFSVKMCC